MTEHWWRLKDYHHTAGVYFLESFPEALTQSLFGQAVQSHPLKFLENKGGGYCGYYVLAQVEQELAGRNHHVSRTPSAILKKLKQLVDQQTRTSPEIKRFYHKQKLHELQNTELGMYLDALGVNWVVISPSKTRGFITEVQSTPDRDRWVFLYNKNHTHWQLVVKTDDTGKVSAIFNGMEAKFIIEHTGSQFPDPTEDTRLLFAPSRDPRDYLMLKEHKSTPKPHASAAKSQSSKPKSKSKPQYVIEIDD